MGLAYFNKLLVDEEMNYNIKLIRLQQKKKTYNLKLFRLRLIRYVF